MQSLLITLLTVSSFARPEEPAAAPPDAGAPAPEGPVAPPTVAVASPAAGAPANVPPAPHWRGTGLSIGAGITGAAGLGFNLARIATVQRLCVGDVVDDCGGGLALAALGPAALTFNTAAFGLSIGAGVMRGRWAANDTALQGGRRRLGGAQVAVGASLMAAGLVGYAAVRIGSLFAGLDNFSCDEQHADFGADYARCVRGRWSGYLAGITITQAASVVGVGLLAHGATYRSNLELYRRMTARQLRLRPVFSGSFAGLSLTGRF